MTRLLLLAALAAPAVGCLNAHPTGPMAKMFGTKPTAADGKTTTPADAKDAKDAKDVKDTPAPGAARLVPPAVLITPGEVAPENPAAAAAKLGNEIEYDLKNTPPAPKTPIISVYKGGEKVR